MKGLSFWARAYIWAILILGVSVIAWSLPELPTDRNQWFVFAVLMVSACAAQLFPVVTSRNQSYELTPIFVFAGVLLLEPAAIALLIVLAFIPEWIRVKKSWYVQLFNIAIYLIQGFSARTLFTWTGGSAAGQLSGASSLAAALLAAALFTSLNHLLLAFALRLARGHSWRETRLFEMENFLVDGALACTGLITALLWEASPWLLGVVAAPLFLIYRGLNTPNLQEQARTDSKTGLYNARHFYQVLQKELGRAARYQRPLAVIMADMDLLRNINNSYGHLAGDMVLKGVADIIRDNLREYDLAARFGGEEFAIIIPETDADQALLVAERLRKQVEDARFVVPTSLEPIKTTISLGVASFPAHGSTANDVIHQADLAVYYSKLQGRNRAWVCSPESRALGPVLVGRRDLEGGLWMPPPKLASAELAAARQSGIDAARASAGDASGTKVTAAGLLRRKQGQTAETGRAKPSPSGSNHGDGRPAEPEKPMGKRLAAFIAAVVVAGLALWAVYRPWNVSIGWLDIAVLAVLTAGAQSLFIETYGRGKISTSAIPLLAGGFLFGMPVALLLAPVIPATVWVRSRGRLYRALFDAGDTTLSAATAVAVYGTVEGWLPSPEPALLLVPAALAALAYYVVNVSLISVAIGLTERRSPIDVWEEKFRWLVVHYGTFGLLAVLMTLAYRAIGLYGLLSFSVPPVMLRYVMKQYTDRTEANVAELKRVNEELLRAHDQVVSTLVELRATYDATLLALSTALDSRDSDTEGHSERVVEYVAAIAGELGLPKQDMPGLLNGALLHDVGKIGVPDAILNKRGPLTSAEWAVMKTHPELGYRMLQHIGFLGDAVPIVRHHHERYDGKGYPDRLSGEKIPLGARIFAVADAFDAMTSDRPYRAALSLEDARAEIVRGEGSQFDPKIVEAFLRVDVRQMVNLSAREPEQEGADAEKRAPSEPQLRLIPSSA